MPVAELMRRDVVPIEAHHTWQDANGCAGRECVTSRLSPVVSYL